MSSSLASIVNGVASDLEHQLGSGARADLRRGPFEEPGATFWRIAAKRLEPSDELGLGDPNPERVRKWAVILWAIAELGPLHQPGQRLGHALRDAGVSEFRMTRLLRAHDHMLARELRALLMHVVSAGQPVDATDVAYLILTDGTSGEERTRHRIARDFFASSHPSTDQ